jgi:hypothetical protein
MVLTLNCAVDDVPRLPDLVLCGNERMKADNVLLKFLKQRISRQGRCLLSLPQRDKI